MPLTGHASPRPRQRLLLSCFPKAGAVTGVRRYLTVGLIYIYVMTSMLVSFPVLVSHLYIIFSVLLFYVF